jgi:hypothetical protein
MNKPGLNIQDLHVEIEKLVRRGKGEVDYIDAVIDYCEKNKLDVEAIAAQIRNGTNLKAKIQESAENLNYLPKTTRLPV